MMVDVAGVSLHFSSCDNKLVVSLWPPIFGRGLNCSSLSCEAVPYSHGAWFTTELYCHA